MLGKSCVEFTVTVYSNSELHETSAALQDAPGSMVVFVPLRTCVLVRPALAPDEIVISEAVVVEEPVLVALGASVRRTTTVLNFVGVAESMRVQHKAYHAPSLHSASYVPVPFCAAANTVKATTAHNRLNISIIATRTKKHPREKSGRRNSANLFTTHLATSLTGICSSEEKA